MKTTTSITIDADLIYKSKKLGINISKLTNDVLKSAIIQYNNKDIDIFKVKEKIEEIQKKISDLKIEEYELNAKIIAAEEKRKARSNKQLKEALKEADMIKRSGVLSRL